MSTKWTWRSGRGRSWSECALNGTTSVRITIQMWIMISDGVVKRPTRCDYHAMWCFCGGFCIVRSQIRHAHFLKLGLQGQHATRQESWSRFPWVCPCLHICSWYVALQHKFASLVILVFVPCLTPWHPIPNPKIVCCRRSTLPLRRVLRKKPSVLIRVNVARSFLALKSKRNRRVANV